MVSDRRRFSEFAADARREGRKMGSTARIKRLVAEELAGPFRRVCPQVRSSGPKVQPRGRNRPPPGSHVAPLSATESASSMSYVVLARKWRPTRFEDLVGQEHVARTLANAIASGRIAHAFLFTGVRGVGKTTSARLLARALNCLGPNRLEGEPDPGPTSTPCLQCAACREITAGSDVDVREIDGASYNGVDEVRKLQDSLPYRPTRDRYKIFIIDEVHMLSQSAWNAFLKTLEEPPAHVKFIFATTEVHKVPVTILSRVQRFDFKMIPARLIADRLRTVLSAEGITTDEAGLSIIAREAAGSMRDAMSLLDQVIAWNDQGLDGESVARVLGVASRKVLHDLASSVVDGDAAASLGVVEQISQQGFDLAHVAKDFLELLRDLVVSKVCTNSDDLIDLPDEERRDVAKLAGRTSPDDLMRVYQGFSAGFDDVLRGSHPRSALEMLLVRLCRRPPLIPLDDLLTRLTGIEKRLFGAGAAPAPRRPVSGPGSGPDHAPQGMHANSQGFSAQEQRPRSREDQTSSRRKEPTSGDGSEEPGPGQLGATAPIAESTQTTDPATLLLVDAVSNEPRRQAPSNVDPLAAPQQPAPVQTRPVQGEPNRAIAAPQQPAPVQARPVQGEPNRTIAAPQQPVPVQARPVQGEPNRAIVPPRAEQSASRRPNVGSTRPRPGATASNQPNSAAAESGQDSVPPLPDPADLMASWQEIVERIQSVRPEVSAVLEHAILLEENSARMLVGWPPNSVFASQFDESLLVELLQFAQRERGLSVRDVLIAKDDPRATGRDTLSTRETAERTRKYREDQAKVRNHPRVRDAVELLGARVVAIKLAES